MPNVWFCADTHWGHSNIITHCNRPFKTTYEMDEKLIQNWNSRVKPNDTVYHLGDFSFRNSRGCEYYLNRLNGNIHLILGNHDKKTKSNRFLWIKDIETIKVEGQDIVLCHYPLEEWEGYYRGYIHLHGHCHGRRKPILGRLDVGVDNQNFMPISLEEVMEQINAQV